MTIVAAAPFVLVLLVLCFALTRDLRRDPIWLRKKLSDSVMRRTVRAAVDRHGHQKFILSTEETTAPPTGQTQAIDATAAGEPIYTPNGNPTSEKPKPSAKAKVE